MSLLENFDWPGNVRELENVIERAVILAKGKILTEDDLPTNIQGQGHKTHLTFQLGPLLPKSNKK